MSDEDCAICGEPLTDKCFHELDCGHTYHYECILKTYTHNRVKTQCPLCRKNGGLLPLVNGLTKLQKYIHYIDEYPEYTSSKCTTILKSGKRKGQTCDNKCMIGQTMCKRHFTMNK